MTRCAMSHVLEGYNDGAAVAGLREGLAVCPLLVVYLAGLKGGTSPDRL